MAGKAALAEPKRFPTLPNSLTHMYINFISRYVHNTNSASPIVFKLHHT